MLNQNYYKREEYLKNNAIPMRKEIKQSLQSNLTAAYFSQVNKDTKVLLGLQPVLAGPGEELWVHPMDELNEHVVLKPVTAREIQALTHTDILAYGDKELEEIEKDKQARIQNAVLENNEVWWRFTKAHTKGCVKEAVRKEREIQNKDILALVNTFNFIYKVNKDTKVLLGLQPVLAGPGEELWVHPMDELNEHVVLKPVTAREIQALTHTDILAYGDKELEEIEKDKQARIQNAVLENNEVWWRFTKAHTKGCVKEAVRKEREIQNKDILALVNTFNFIYKNGLTEAQTKFDKQTDILIHELRDITKRKNCCEQDKKKMAELTAKMKKECDARLTEELDKQREHFDSVLMLERGRFAFEMEERKSTLRHELECRGMVDILYMACMEKHYYHSRTTELEAKHNREKECFERVRNELTEQLRETGRRLADQTEENIKLKENMRSLCQEFRRLFSCHTNLPFEQLGFLPQFEKIFIDNIYTEPPKTEKHQDDKSKHSRVHEPSIQHDKGFSHQQMHVTPETVKPSYFESSLMATSGKISNSGTMYVSQTHEIFLGMFRRGNSEQSEESAMSAIVNGIIQQARQGLRTSILKTIPNSVSNTGAMAPPPSFAQSHHQHQRDTMNEDPVVHSNLHYRDSLAILKEKVDTGKSSTEYFKMCPEPECQFATILDYDFPPHVAHLALTNYDKVQTFDLDNYADYTIDELKLLTDLFYDMVKRDSGSTETSLKKDLDVKSSSSSSIGCSRKSQEAERKEHSVDMDQIKDEVLKQKDLMKGDKQYTMEYPTDVTKEIIQQIFMEHPSLTNCVLDL